MPSIPLEAKLWNHYQVCIYSTQRTGCFGSNSQWSTLFWNPIRIGPHCFEFHSQQVVCVVNQQKQPIYLKFADDMHKSLTIVYTHHKENVVTFLSTFSCDSAG